MDDNQKFWDFMEGQMRAPDMGAGFAAAAPQVTPQQAAEIIRGPADFGEDAPVIIEAASAEEAKKITGGAPVRILPAGSGWLQEEDADYADRWRAAEREAEGKKPLPPGVYEFRIL